MELSVSWNDSYCRNTVEMFALTNYLWIKLQDLGNYGFFLILNKEIIILKKRVQITNPSTVNQKMKLLDSDGEY